MITDISKLLHLTSDYDSIGIDGVPGAGKTTIAEMLARENDVTLISFDSYLDRDKGGFEENIDFITLKKDIKKAQLKGRKVIIEGNLLINILKKIEIAPQIVMYIVPCINCTKFSTYKMLHEKSLLEILSYYKEEKEQWPKVSFILDIEVAHYHKEYNPKDNSLIVYQVL